MAHPNRSKMHDVPVVMSFACLDPTGGMGLQADIEAASFLYCHCCPIVTTVLARDTCGVKDVIPQPSTIVIEQARAVLEDLKVDAIKIGMLGSVENAIALSTLLSDYQDLPVVFDPVLKPLTEEFQPSNAYLETLQHDILPLTSVILLHATEARLLTHGADSLEAAAQEVMAQGCDNVLIVKAKENNTTITNEYYAHRRFVKAFEWERLPDAYLGAGSTLSGSVAAFLAQGLDARSAIRESQAYTWQTLKHSHRLGMGKHIPKRWYNSHTHVDTSN